MGVALHFGGIRHTLAQWWPRARKFVVAAFVLAVLWVLVSLARNVDWPGVWQAVQRLSRWQIAGAVGLAALSYAIYGSYDVIARHEMGLRLPPWRMAGIAAVSYAFNLNMGAILGGFGMRVRLYGRLGLPVAQVTQIVGWSMLTNWLGYLLLAGGCFVLRLLEVPETWSMAPDTLAALGVVLLVVATSYLYGSILAPGRSWQVRGHELTLPHWRVALLQAGLSMANWMMIAGIIHVLLPGDVRYPVVLAALLVSAIAGIISRIPAGLGVIEAVFVALMGGKLGAGSVIAALLAYRAIYYLLPLAVALLAYLKMEASARAAR